MNVFISWSGERSRQVAKLLHEWIQCVIQASKPWMSSEDLSKGSAWFAKLSSELDSTQTGIVCLTQANKNNPWILYETGSLAKGISDCRVYTFLIDLEPKDLVNPLAQFNHTKPNKADLLKLIKSINGNLSQGGLDDVILQKVFDTYWPVFEKPFNEILSKTENEEVATPPITTEDLVGEVLSTVRSLDRRMSRMEMDSKNREYVTDSQSSNYHISERAKLEMWGMDEAEIQRRLDLGMVLEIYAPKLETIGGREIPKGFFGKKIDDKK